MADRSGSRPPYEVASLVLSWGWANKRLVQGSLLRNSGLRWRDLSFPELYAVMYAELCVQCGGKEGAEKNIEAWQEQASILEATRKAQARAAMKNASLPGARQHDEVAWADADRRALANLSKAD